MQYLTLEELRERWRKDSVRTVRRILARHGDVLRPVKIGGSLLVSDAAVKKYEERMRLYE